MAVIKAIEFDDSEQLESVTVKLTAAEAAFIALFTGKQTGEEDEDVMPGGSEVSSHLYEAFTKGTFNMLYDSGVSGWLADQG